MKVAMLGDRRWLTCEAMLLRHLVFGLSDEFVRAVPIFPTDAADIDLPGVTERLIYQPSRFDGMTSWRIRRLASRLCESDADLVHVLDGRFAKAGRALAEQAELPLVVNCWTADQLQTVLRWGEGAAGVILPSQTMQDARTAGGEVEHQSVHVVRPGVLRQDELFNAPLKDPATALCVVVVVEDGSNASTAALLQSIAQIRHSMPQLQVFIYPLHTDSHRIWMAASKLNLLSQVSMVGPEAGSQELLAGVDAVVIPQSIQYITTLPLSAMAAARPMIVAPSPLVDFFLPGQTCESVNDANSAGQWAELFWSLIRRPDHFKALGESARQYVQEHHGIGRYVMDVLRVYRETVGEPLKFDQNPNPNPESP